MILIFDNILDCDPVGMEYGLWILILTLTMTILSMAMILT